MKIFPFKKKHSILRLRIGTVVLAAFLWFYVALNETYSDEIECRIVLINLQQGKILASPLPETITLNISGKGVDLMWLNLFWKSDLQFNLDLETISSYFNLTLVNYLSWITVPRGFENAITVNNIVYPETIVVELDFLDSVRIPISDRNITFSLTEGYTQVGDILFQPDSVTVSGPRRTLREIAEISTVVLAVEDEDEKFSDEIDLEYPDNQLITYSQKSVIATVIIQKIGEITIGNVPIVIVRNSSYYQIEFRPSTISLRVTGGVEYIKELTEEDFTPTIVFDRSWVRGGEYYAPVNLEWPTEILDREITPPNVTVEVH